MDRNDQQAIGTLFEKIANAKNQRVFRLFTLRIPPIRKSHKIGYGTEMRFLIAYFRPNRSSLFPWNQRNCGW